MHVYASENGKQRKWYLLDFKDHFFPKGESLKEDFNWLLFYL